MMRVRDMNDNDKPNFAPKLSLAPLNEDVANNQLKMVCPKCGYKPKDPSDPLLTKHNGLGECPKCGVIPKNFLRIKESQNSPTHLQQKEMRIAVDHHRRDPKGSKLGVLSIAIGVVLFFGVFSLLKPKDQSKAAVNEAKKILSQFPYDIRGAWQGQVVHEVKFRSIMEGYRVVPENIIKEELENPTASRYIEDYNISLMIDENYIVKEIEWTDRHEISERSVVSWAAPSYMEYFMEARKHSAKEHDLQQPFVRYFTIQRDASKFSMKVSNSPYSADPDILLESVPIADVEMTQQPTRNIFRYDEKEQAMRAEVVVNFIPIKKLNVPLNSIKNWYVTPRNAYDNTRSFLGHFHDKQSKDMQQPVNGFFQGLDFKFTLSSGCFTFWVTQAKLSIAFFQSQSEGGSKFLVGAEEDRILHLSTSSTVEVSANCAPTAEILFYRDGRKLVRIKDRNIAAGKPLEYSISNR